MTLTGGSITAEAENSAIMSRSAMTITNATVKATAQKNTMPCVHPML